MRSSTHTQATGRRSRAHGVHYVADVVIRGPRVIAFVVYAHASQAIALATFRVLAKGDVEADAALASEVGCPPALRSLTPAPGERSQSRGAVGAALPRLS
ncbi:MAG: hypothetical protein WB761_02690, partial [Solirubrobacteraceae bacterium]